MKFTGDDIAAAFGHKAPSTRCATCNHKRSQHNREVLRAGGGEGSESFHECEQFDGRRKSGRCPCEKFTEPSPVSMEKVEKR